MQTVTLSVSDEFASAGNAIALLISDIKAGKAISQIVADTLPGLIAAVGGYANMAADIKLVDNQAFLLLSVISALEPVPAAAPAPAAT